MAVRAVVLMMAVVAAVGRGEPVRNGNDFALEWSEQNPQSIPAWKQPTPTFCTPFATSAWM